MGTTVKGASRYKVQYYALYYCLPATRSTLNVDIKIFIFLHTYGRKIVKPIKNRILFYYISYDQVLHHVSKVLEIIPLYFWLILKVYTIS